MRLLELQEMQYLFVILHLGEFVVACRCTVWARTDSREKVVGRRLTGLWRKVFMRREFQSWDFIRWDAVQW